MWPFLLRQVAGFESKAQKIGTASTKGDCGSWQKEWNQRTICSAGAGRVAEAPGGAAGFHYDNLCALTQRT